jgi:NTP pyrophosphatase (non-canonical NTP hydrolase)
MPAQPRGRQLTRGRFLSHFAATGPRPARSIQSLLSSNFRIAMASTSLTLDELQQLIDRMYSRKDQARGVDGTFMWLMEEVGELAAALRGGTPEELAAEFADVLAWLATIANVAGVNLGEAVAKKYGAGCPGCGQMICACGDTEKP